jgi:L-aspartate oxidase
LPLPAPGSRRETDVVVVGTGAAGLATAVRLAEAGIATTVLGKGHLGDGSTAWAQGGLAAVLPADHTAADSVARHIDDTLAAGAGLCDVAVVTELAVGAPAAIERLIGLGARFDRDAAGWLSLGLEGGHRARRIVHAGGDASGAEVARTLSAIARHAVAEGRVTLVEDTLAVDTLADADGVVCGVRTIEAGHAVVGEWRARAVVLATGGIGGLWPATTNPPTSTGDGLAMALRAGAAVRDVEFVQFHPTVLAVPGPRSRSRAGVLVSEAVRGDGAVVRDADGDRVMAGVHPLADLAPRDVVSAAMARRMLGTGAGHLYLDGTGLGSNVWAQHFPHILAMCRRRGIDPVTEPIPIRPAAHYHCGGVIADLDGRTPLPGLYAVGEVAGTGVHGANRLASNSLTEALVAGDRCALLLAGDLPTRRRPRPSRSTGPTYAGVRRGALRAGANRYAGVLRDAGGLAAWTTSLTEMPETARMPGWADVETTNLHGVASTLAHAAASRTESRGGHRRLDHPGPDPAWSRHQSWVLSEGGPVAWPDPTTADAVAEKVA